MENRPKVTTEMWEKIRKEVLFGRPESFKSELVLLTNSPVTPRDMTHNVHHTQLMDPEDP